MITLGHRIRELREGKGLSLRAFSKLVGGLSAPFLSDVELGRRHPSDAVLAKMAAALGTPVTELKRLDSRAPIEELRRLSNADPIYGFAFQKLVDKQVSAEELLRFLEKQPDRKKGKGR